MRKFIILTFISVTFNISAYSQTRKQLDKLDRNYQVCLDAGQNMLACARHYYTGMDSLLNVVYKNYRATLNENSKQKLKSEQLKWLSQRDTYFNRIDQNYLVKERSGTGGTDARMFAIDEKAQFVRKRVIYFIEKLNRS